MATYIPLQNTPIQLQDPVTSENMSGGSLEFYLAGTTTATDLYSDNAGTSIGTSITLNSAGMPESGGNTITLFRDQSKALKIVGKDASGATVFTSDNIPAVASFDSASAEKLDYITVTQDVDLDTMETDLATAYQVDGTVALTADVTVPSGLYLNRSTATGITASVTQTQGQQLLSNEINDVTTVANDGDVVTLPTAVVGREVTVINNGANSLQVFPSTDDSIGDGAADTSVSMDANTSRIFKAVSISKWEPIASSGSGSSSSSTTANYGSYYDEGNTTAFVINAQTDLHAYHTASLADGGSDGWTFDPGGQGVPVAIASIADGADSGVDIEVTTTGNHGLAVGDIISQTNLASAVYTGIFQVKAIISNTQYEVEAVYTATDTGTMDQAATLTCDTGSGGVYVMDWAASASAATSSDVFDFNAYLNTTAIDGSTVRRKFGTGGDIGSMSGCSPVFTVVPGDKISFMLSNASGAGNMTIRNLVVRIDEQVATDASASTFTDDTFRIQDNGDNTKKLAFEASGITTGTTRTMTVPDRDISVDDARRYVGQNLQTGTSYELVLADAGKIVEMNNASANSLNIPANSAVAFPVDTRIDIIQYGAGTTTVTITTDTLTGEVVSTGQYKAMSLWKRAATEWVCIGGTT